jgi:predicted N-acyltransferase
MTAFITEVRERISDIDAADWNACFPGEAENHAYYAACQEAGPRGLEMACVVVRSGTRVVAVAPLFRLSYRLDTSLQGHWRPLGEWAASHFPKLVSFPVVGVGSPYAERCHVGLRPGLSAAERHNAVAALIEGIEAFAGAEGVGLVAIKDLAEHDEPALARILKERGYSRIGGLPTAVLELPYANEGAYLASLSSSTRKDVRRKMRSLPAVRIEERTSIADIAGEIDDLYAMTRTRSGLDYGDFETLPDGYFSAVSKALGNRAVFMLYWVGDELAAFNLLLVEPDRVIDKFIGMRYPLAQEHNLYVVSWMTAVGYCLRHGIGRLQTGQTAYAWKLRLGSRLETSAIYFHHRRPFTHKVLAAVGTLIAFDKMDPDLRSARRRAA